MRKEFNHIRHDRRLALSLILPPTLQLLIFGFALSAEVTNIRLGVVDDSRTPESRELIATMTESKSFRLSGYYFSADQLGDAIGRGDLDAGVVIPYDYARDLRRGRAATVQFLLNAMNANTAAIAQGYVEAVLQNYNRRLQRESIDAGTPSTTRRRADAFDDAETKRRASSVERRTSNVTNVERQSTIPESQSAIEEPAAALPRSNRGQATLHPAFLFNPGLVGSWFIVTGVLGLLLILNSSLVASNTMVKEREAGTIEQLLMSPAGAGEIILAKIAPLFILLFLMALLAMGIIKAAFNVPFHGNPLLVLAGAALCILSGISIGTVNATFSKSRQQAQLMSFFVNPPLASLSGALNPVEAMPSWLQPLTALNPIHHFAHLARASLLKGSGLETLWPNFLALLAFTLVLVSLSVWRFRKQLG